MYILFVTFKNHDILLCEHESTCMLESNQYEQFVPLHVSAVSSVIESAEEYVVNSHIRYLASEWRGASGTAV